MADPRTFTYQTRIAVDSGTDAALQAYATLYGHAERCLYADYAAAKDTTQDKPAFMRHHGVTSRQYNAIDAGIKGKITSIKERRSGLIEESAIRIKKAKSVVTRLKKPAKSGLRRRLSSDAAIKLVETLAERRSRLFQLHQKKRRLDMLEARHAALVKDDTDGTVRIAFGSRKLFRAQFALEANGLKDHTAWRKKWREVRCSQFMVIGSKDETAGCQGCVASVNETGDLNLQVRLPEALSNLGKHITIQNVRFAYGAENILKALASSHVVTSVTPEGKKVRRLDGYALTYRFIRDEIGWRVMVSVAVAAVSQVSHRLLGAIGVDVNADHLAVTEVDRYRNIIGFNRIDTFVQGKSADQRTAILGDAACALAQMAKHASKPAVIEKLDFRVKKSQLEAVDRRRSRILSALAYRQAAAMIKAACFRAGVEVIEVNPAYSSVLGAVNHAQQHGISVHLGAAAALARRGLGLSERPTVRTGITPARNGAQLTFDLPVRLRSKHVWSFWSKVRTRLKAAHTGHVRSGGARQPPAPLRSSSQAESPTRALPVRPRHANRYPNCSGNVWQDVPW